MCNILECTFLLVDVFYFWVDPEHLVRNCTGNFLTKFQHDLSSSINGLVIMKML